MHNLISDLRAAFRSLARHPRFVLGAAATLALGIGATVTLVGAVDALLFRPPVGVADPERVVRMYFRHSNPQFGGWINSSVSYPDFTDLSGSKAFAKVTGIMQSTGSLGRGAEARRVSLALVAGDYFGMYGARPLLGRLLRPDEGQGGDGSPALVLSEALWRTRFGADSGILGRTLPIDDKVYTVAGVAARGFDGGDFDPPEAWAALGAIDNPLGDDYRTNRGWYFIALLGRLAPGVTRAQGAAEATGIISAARSDSSTRNGFQEVLLGPVQEARGPDHSQEAKLALWLAAVSLGVLLIACANVANLLLARGLVRSRELAIRKALGAGRARLVRQLLFEGFGLSLLAGAAGIGVASWSGGLLRHFILPSGLADTPTVDPRLLVIALVATLVAALLATLVPALHAVRGDLTPVLKDGGVGAGFRRSRLRGGLVVVQIGISVVLVIGAGLFVRSLQNALAIDVGYDRSHVIMVSANPAQAGFHGVAVGTAFDGMADVARRHPGVETVALTFGEPFGWSMALQLEVPGHDSLLGMSSGGMYIQSVTADYFRTMGLKILRGHGFTDADRREQPAVALLGATMARRIFGPADPTGACLLLKGATTCTQVIGVVQDGIRYRPQEEAQALYYVPLPPAGDATSHLTLFIRTKGDATALTGTIAPLLQTAVPGLPYVQVRSLEEILAPSYRAFRLGATLFGLFGITAMVLAGIGIYAVLAYAVRARTRELGIRLALGAEPATVRRLVLGDGLRLAGLGIAAGLLAALLLGRLLSSLLYGVAPGDPLTLAAAALVVLLAAFAASVLPARRATRIDPMAALRGE